MTKWMRAFFNLSHKLICVVELILVVNQVGCDHGGVIVYDVTNLGVFSWGLNSLIVISHAVSVQNDIKQRVGIVLFEFGLWSCRVIVWMVIGLDVINWGMFC